MSSTTICSTSQVNHRPFHNLLPRKSPIHHPNLALSRLQEQSAQVTSPRISPPINTIAEGDTAAKANVGINEIIPVERTSSEWEQLVVQKLKEAFEVQPDQTTVLVRAV